MKFAAFIFALYVLLLVVKPAVGHQQITADAVQDCCAGMCDSDAERGCTDEPCQDGGACGKMCNPFQVCSTCLLVCPGLPFSFEPELLAAVSICPARLQLSPGRFATDFWQPPKLV